MADEKDERPAPARDALIDRYLADCVTSRIASAALPQWPSQLSAHERAVVPRVCFHGIALMLWEGDLAAAHWPPETRTAVRSEAMAQSFWEQSHHKVISDLLEAMFDNGIEPVITKGTAIAYSLYLDRPALRRRGDSDIVVPRARLSSARKVLKQLGFARQSEPLIYQETWAISDKGRFDHVVDLHWLIDGSATVASHLEAGAITARKVRLPALSRRAVGIDPLGNLLLICLNRSEHSLHGYVSDGEKLFEGDRLIWAVDIDASCKAFAQSDFDELLALARTTGSAASVSSGLEFAQRVLGTQVPAPVLAALDAEAGSNDLNRYLTSRSKLERLRLEWSHAPRGADKLKQVKSAILPSKSVLRERFPALGHWPVAALVVRRLFEGLLKGVRGQL